MWEGNEQPALWIKESTGEETQRRGAPSLGASRHLLTMGPQQNNLLLKLAPFPFFPSHMYEHTRMQTHRANTLPALHAASTSSTETKGLLCSPSMQSNGGKGAFFLCFSKTKICSIKIGSCPGYNEANFLITSTG